MMAEPLPFLAGGVPGDTERVTNAYTRVRRGLPPRVKAAVLTRDRHICRWCAFRSRRYQEVVVLDTYGRDPDAMAAACLFCHQCFHLDYVPVMRSGVFVWLPEVDQIGLHHLAREVYIFRISRGPRAERARRALDHLFSRRRTAKDRTGLTGETEILDAIVSARARGERPEPLDGIRLLPLDRRILNAGGLEFNQFPQVLAYWRSAEGPFGRQQAQPWIDWYLAEVVGEPPTGSDA
jgi:intracellular multiplication protein IcmJ